MAPNAQTHDIVTPLMTTAAPGIRAFTISLAPLLLLGAVSAPARADGLSAYLPLNLEPEMERQIERVLILADEPVLKRPFAVELVKLALPQACRVDKPLCRKVERYLERYSRDYGVTHASITGAGTHDRGRRRCAEFVRHAHQQRLGVVRARLRPAERLSAGAPAG